MISFLQKITGILPLGVISARGTNKYKSIALKKLPTNEKTP